MVVIVHERIVKKVESFPLLDVASSTVGITVDPVDDTALLAAPSLLSCLPWVLRACVGSTVLLGMRNFR